MIDLLLEKYACVHSGKSCPDTTQGNGRRYTRRKRGRKRKRGKTRKKKKKEEWE